MLSVIMTSWCGDLIGVCHIGVCHIGVCQGLPDTFIASLLPCRNRKFSRLIPLIPQSCASFQPRSRWVVVGSERLDATRPTQMSPRKSLDILAPSKRLQSSPAGSQ